MKLDFSVIIILSPSRSGETKTAKVSAESVAEAKLKAEAENPGWKAIYAVEAW